MASGDQFSVLHVSVEGNAGNRRRVTENLRNDGQPVGFLEADGGQDALQAVHAFASFRAAPMYLAPSKADSAT